jgi:transposase
MARRSDVVAAVTAVPDIPESGTTHLGSLRDEQRTRDQVNRTKAISLKLAGLSDEAIGEQLDMSVSGVRDLIRRTLDRAENRVVEEMRDLENAKLDRVQTAIWTKVIEGDLKAVDTYLRLSARRAKLNGLDQPMKIDLSLTVREEMEQALTQLEHLVLRGEVVRDEMQDPS